MFQYRKRNSNSECSSVSYCYECHNLFRFISNNNSIGNPGRRNLFMEYRSNYTFDYSFTGVDNFLFSSIYIGRLCKFAGNWNDDGHTTTFPICFRHSIQHFNLHWQFCYIYCHTNKWRIKSNLSMDDQWSECSGTDSLNLYYVSSCQW